MNKTEKNMYLISSIIMATAIMIGAFGAHALQKLAPPNLMQTFAVGARYQIYMGLSLFGLSLFYSFKKIDVKIPFKFILFGMLIFCGCIYTYVLTQVKFFAMIVPVGGASMILGWGWFVKTILNQSKA